VKSVEWLLLEWLVPLSTWLHLELSPVPNLVVVTLLLALIGSLAIAITVVGTRIPAAVSAGVAKPRRSISSSDGSAVPPAYRDAPVGGSGPRAPSARFSALLFAAR